MNDYFKDMTAGEVYLALTNDPSLIEHVSDDIMIDIELWVMDVVAIKRAGGSHMVFWDDTLH